MHHLAKSFDLSLADGSEMPVGGPCSSLLGEIEYEGVHEGESEVSLQHLVHISGGCGRDHLHHVRVGQQALVELTPQLGVPSY